jgi:hypothetical protein
MRNRRGRAVVALIAAAVGTGVGLGPLGVHAGFAAPAGATPSDMYERSHDYTFRTSSGRMVTCSIFTAEYIIYESEPGDGSAIMRVSGDDPACADVVIHVSGTFTNPFTGDPESNFAWSRGTEMQLGFGKVSPDLKSQFQAQFDACSCSTPVYTLPK